MKKIISAFRTGVILIAGLLVFAGCKRNRHSIDSNLKIGAILSLSGNGSGTGNYTLKGIQLAVKEQNAAGGLLGQQIELEIRDSKGDPETGLNLAKEMLSGNTLPFMVCSNTSGVSLAIKPETEGRKIILVASAATDKLLENANYTIRNFIESDQISKEILQYLKNTLSLTSIGVFYANNEFGNSVSSKVAEKAPGLAVDLPFNVSYDDKSLDFSALIAGQDIDNVPAIYVVGLGTSLGTFIKQLREAGYEGMIMADPLFNNPEIKAAAGTAANGVEFIDFAFDKSSDDASVKTFVNAHNAEFKSQPENLAAITYDAVKMLFAAIEKANSLDYKKLEKPTEAKKYHGVTGNLWVNMGNIIYPTVFKMGE